METTGKDKIVIHSVYRKFKSGFWIKNTVLKDDHGWYAQTSCSHSVSSAEPSRITFEQAFLYFLRVHDTLAKQYFPDRYEYAEDIVKASAKKSALVGEL